MYRASKKVKINKESLNLLQKSFNPDDIYCVLISLKSYGKEIHQLCKPPKILWKEDKGLQGVQKK